MCLASSLVVGLTRTRFYSWGFRSNNAKAGRQCDEHQNGSLYRSCTLTGGWELVEPIRNLESVTGGYRKRPVHVPSASLEFPDAFCWREVCLHTLPQRLYCQTTIWNVEPCCTCTIDPPCKADSLSGRQTYTNH